MPRIISLTCRRLAPIVALWPLLLTGCNGTESSTETAGRVDHAADPGEPWFVEVSAEVGVEFTYESGHRDRFLMPECLGGGAALFDMNANGWLDLYLVQSGSLHDPRDMRPGNALYRNEDGQFLDVTESSGAADRGYGMGVAVGDYTNNGFPDLFVANVGRDTLLRNNGDETFTDVTEAAGVGDAGWSSAAAFLDYNLNGWLDLYVGRYLHWSIDTEIDCYNSKGSLDYCSPVNYNAPAQDLLYRNNADGSFTDISALAGLEARYGTALGVVCGDFTGNGWIDIFVANDGMLDQLWANQGDGRFEDIALRVGVAVDHEGIAKAGMGVAAADVNDNGLLDVIVCNLQGESDSFFLNEGSYFTDWTSASGIRPISRAYTRFGMAWLDFDNDGYLDLFQVNGRVMRQSHRHCDDDPYAEPNLLFRGEPGPSFRPVNPPGGVTEQLIRTSRAAAFGDIDNDGAIDIIIVNRDGPVDVLRNVIGRQHNWIIFRVLDERGRDAYNATITLKLGPRTITRDVRSAYSYLAANDPRVHVGLGGETSVRDVHVRWPDGTTSRFGDLEANRIHTLRPGTAATAPSEDGGKGPR